MPPNPTPPHVHTLPPQGFIKRLLGGLSLFTMVMTVPQVLTIWISHRAAGISMRSWGAYLFSAVAWLWYGLQKRDKNIHLPSEAFRLLEALRVFAL